ncbi:glycosyltransferase family 2 protein [Sphingobacterium multivorum]|uniref:glycosyltransferase family 2 protein n=1 Tax=Sphingobacterium multivorum TaxID=28454 RepID=UPI0028ACC07F|nr:glycosyltransferase family 2 protein [Sphingobacterium multivorum]
MNKISAITVTYNPDIKVLERQIFSIIGQVENVVLIDNGSFNIEEIQSLLASIKMQNSLRILTHFNTANVGLAAAQNQGIALSKNIGDTHFLLLDQDSILESSFVANLLASEAGLIASGIKVGVVGASYYNKKTGENYPITRYWGPFIERVIPSSEPVEATFVIASGSLISHKVVDEVGNMDERLFIDYIDVEWAFRAKLKGYTIYASPLAKMEHNIGDSRTSVFGRKISVHSPLRRYYLYRNSIFMLRNKSIDSGYKLREITFNFMRFVVFMCLSKEKLKYLKYSFFGIIDGIRGRVGKCPYSW